jgi:ferrous iron transport protein A
VANLYVAKGGCMPLSMVSDGEEFLIKKINGKEEVRRFLENLGFVAGAQVSLVSKISGNLIVQIKDSRVAISREMAQKIIV